jgi:hypothetical protein
VLARDAESFVPCAAVLGRKHVQLIDADHVRVRTVRVRDRQCRDLRRRSVLPGDAVLVEDLDQRMLLRQRSALPLQELAQELTATLSLPLDRSELPRLVTRMQTCEQVVQERG